jgi:GNAT superfamily N-acetyltransferase
MNAEPELRRGTGADADMAAEVYLRARHYAAPEIPALAHPDDEVRQWMHRVVDEQETWLAVAEDGTVLGLMVLDGDWIEQLYTDPAWTGRGLGARNLAGQAARPWRHP